MCYRIRTTQWLMALNMLALSPVGLAAEVAIKKPADRVAILAPYVDDDTFAALRVDLTKIDLDTLAAAASHWITTSNGDEETLRPMIANTKTILGELRSAGATTIHTVMGLGDIHQGGGPLTILAVDSAGDPRAIEQQLQKLTANLPPGAEVKRQENVFLIGAAPTIERYQALRAAERPDLTEPTGGAASEGVALLVVVSPGPDFRRVVREIWPELPSPFAPLKGELADRWQRLELAVNLPPDASAKLVLQTTDAAAAETFAQFWSDLPAAIEQVREDRGQLDRRMKQKLDRLVAALSPRVEDTRVVIELPTDQPQLANLSNFFHDATSMAMESTWMQMRMQKFKQMALAMHSYHDKHKHLPASAAIRDPNGRPLLSWRVAVLPYIDEDALYKQFHLDEPWDSPHNKTLIEKMPGMFADPDANLKKLAREGRTTYQIPVGPETMFFNDEGAIFRDVKDGTSQTIMIVEVGPEHAVIWTKPADWEVDLERPRRALERTDRDSFVAAYGDGSTRALPVRIKEETLKALVTRAGGEVVSGPYETDPE